MLSGTTNSKGINMCFVVVPDSCINLSSFYYTWLTSPFVTLNSL